MSRSRDPEAMAIEDTRTDVAVIGGGISGFTAACTLARLGLRVTILEKEARPGGRVAELACMATTKCRRCSACLMGDLRAEAARYPSIFVRTGCEVTGGSRNATGVEIAISRPGQAGTGTIAARGAMICTGFDAFDAARKPFLGYGRLAGVVTTLDLDHEIARAGGAPWTVGGAVPKKVAFVQCVGSRESRDGRGYCSQVCCQVSLRLAGKILHLAPGTEITVHYIDLQLAKRGILATREDLAGKVRLVQGVPGEIEAAPGGGLLVRHEDGGDGSGTSTVFDAVVLAVGMVPRPSTARVAEALGLAAGEYGFAAAGGPPVVAAGACTFPSDIPGSMNAARDAARAIARALGAGYPSSTEARRG